MYFSPFTTCSIERPKNTEQVSNHTAPSGYGTRTTTPWEKSISTASRQSPPLRLVYHVPPTPMRHLEQATGGTPPRGGYLPADEPPAFAFAAFSSSSAFCSWTLAMFAGTAQ